MLIGPTHVTVTVNLTIADPVEAKHPEYARPTQMLIERLHITFTARHGVWTRPRHVRADGHALRKDGSHGRLVTVPFFYLPELPASVRDVVLDAMTHLPDVHVSGAAK